MADSAYPKIAGLSDTTAFRARLAELGVQLPCDEAVLSKAQGSPLAQPADVGGFIVGNRWAIHPMEGWDGRPDGTPTDLTLRRWRHFGMSGAKLIWGGEAFAVQADGRGNPNQLGLIDRSNEQPVLRGLVDLLTMLRSAHAEAFGQTDDLLIGLQLTHSGRFSRPVHADRYEPRLAYHHPILDRRIGVSPNDDSAIVSDDWIERTIESHVGAAELAERAGFRFVDIKQCHGYLGHELLSAFTRKGKFGGSFENRTRFISEIVRGIRQRCPRLMIGIRLSAFDRPPYHPNSAHDGDGKRGPGIPEEYSSLLPYRYAFGCDQNNPLEIDLTEPIALVRAMQSLGVRLFNVSCGSPYYNPHIQRPAIFPPCDGYEAPEDPLLGVARQIDVTRQIKQACPGAVVVGTGYTYLQEFLPLVAQAVVREGWTDFVGVGRLVLSYWELIADTLAGRPIQHKRFCRTFSDCTTAARNGINSGCFPLDDFYKRSPEHERLKLIKLTLRKSLERP